MPAAEHYAHALVTAAKHTGENPESIADGSPDSKFRHYAFHALLNVFPKSDRTAVAQALGAPGKAAYFFRTSLWHVLGDGPHRNGPIEWWDTGVLALTIRAVEKAVPRLAPTDASLSPSCAKPATPFAVKPTPPPLKLGPLPKPKIERREVRVPGETERIVVRNGVTLDLLDRMITHRGGAVVLNDDGVRLVAMLARVMPAFLPTDRLAEKVFGQKADSHVMLKGLIDRLNPELKRAQLEVRAIPKMGYMIADLGA